VLVLTVYACAVGVFLLWFADKILSKFGEGERSRLGSAVWAQRREWSQCSMQQAQLHSKRMETEHLQNSRC
jgi:hypothetical protein